MKSNGDICRGYALTDSEYCFAHDPTRRHEFLQASRSGGHGKTPRMNLEDIAMELEWVFRQMKRGKISPSEATAYRTILRERRDVESDRDFDRRLRAIEGNR